MHFSVQVEFHTPLMTFDASNNVTCLTSPNPHCTFLNLLHVPTMIGTKLISLPLTTMIRLKCVMKVVSRLRVGRNGIDPVPSDPRKGRRVKLSSFPSQCTLRPRSSYPKRPRIVA